MTREEYLEKQRNRAVEVARGMADGTIHYLDGVVELSSLRFEVGLPENDADFFMFATLASEVDHLPLGKVRQYWSEESLKKQELELEQAIEWAKKHSLSNCQSIIERFSI